MAESLKPEWRPDGSLVISCTGEILELTGLLRLLFIPSAVEELQQILLTRPKQRVAGQHERGSGV